MSLLLFTLAEAAPAVAPKGSPLQFPIMMLLLFGVMYFMMIRPQRRRDKERKAMIANVKSGERVLLTSGIIGQVCTVKDTTLIVRIADNTKVEVVKAAISQILEKGETPSELEPTK
jgi:preprotein translocase subunit YajC